MKQDKPSRWYVFQVRLRQSALGLMRWLAGGSALLVLILIVTIVAGWLLYTTTWQVLSQTVGLPPVITEVNPAINSQSLEEIRAWQELVDRRTAQSFPRADQVIVTGPR